MGILPPGFTHQHLFVPKIVDADLEGTIGNVMSLGRIRSLLESGWGEISDLLISNHYEGIPEAEAD